MSKKKPSAIHREFYRSRTPKHDELLLRCTSENGRELILHYLNEWILKDVLMRYNRTHNFSEEVTERNISGPVIDDYSIEVKVNLPRSTFTIGWADLLLYGNTSLGYYEIHKEYDHITSEKKDVKKSYKDILKFTILVEIKPKLDDIGAVIRQIKTYRNGLSDSSIFKIFCLVVTYSSPPIDVVELLQHEGIKVLSLTPIENRETEKVVNDAESDCEDPYLMK
ncbi:MAG: hypothetical protein ACTSV2_14445 [Candidatus Thorarchaeota archaeon]